MKTFNLLLFLALILGVYSAEAQTKKAGEIKFGFLENLEKTGGGYQIKIDYAEMFEGDAAEREAKKDAAEFSPDEASGIYIRNVNPKIHTEKVAASAVVVILKNLEPQKLTLASFELLRGGKLKSADGFWGFPQYGAGGEPMPCRVTVINGTVTKIEQVYFP